MKVLFLALAIGFAVALPPVKIQPFSLLEDLLEFLALVPVDKIQAITEDHLQNDADFCRVVTYLQGDDWKNLVATVQAREEVQELNKYLTDAGLPVDIINAIIVELIDEAKCTASGTGTGSLRSFLDEIEAALPVDELKKLLEDKLQNSADFQELYNKISSQKAHDLVNEIRALAEVQEIIARLKELGVKVDEIANKVCSFLGWECTIP